MSKVDVAWNAFLDTLNSQLKEIEERTFKRSEWASIADARDRMIRVMRSTESGRCERGLAVRDYQNQYRQNGGEQVWRDGAGAKIARADGNSNAKSTGNWIEDAEFAEPLGDLLRDAMLKRNYDPTARKNRDIVRSLLEKLSHDDERLSDNDIDAAVKLVDEVISARTKGKRNQGAPSTADLEDQLVARISKFIIKYRKPPWKEALDEIYKQVATMLKDERAERASGISKNGSARIPPLHSDTRALSGPTVVRKSVGPALSMVGSSRPPRKTTVKSWQYDKKLHPWGDVWLDTLRLQNAGPAGRGPGEFHRKLLYEVRDVPKATRFLLAGMLDLFDPGIPDRIFDEHLDVFLQASRHTFLALTPHADSVRRHWERRKTMSGKPGFPDNFWTGVTVDCVDHLQRLNILPGKDMRTKCASFVDYRSDASRPLAKSSFRSDIWGLALVVFGWDFADPQSPLSSEDACSLAQAAKHSGTRFFFTHPESKQAFLTGNPSISELPPATNPQVSNPGLTTLLEEAKSHQRFPDGWSGCADWGRKQHFKTFEGEEVEFFDLRSDIG
jgi:protein gp37